MCFIMKARYNCAHNYDNNNNNQNKKKASDFKLILEQQPNMLANNHTTNTTTTTTTVCDLRQLVEAVGGPQGVAQQILLRRRQQQQQQQQQQQYVEEDGTIDSGNDNNNNNKFQMLLYGSSFLRQVFEAMVCAFESQITDLRVQVGGPSISLAALKQRKNALIQKEEFINGSTTTTFFIGYDEARTGGCHDANKDLLENYYRKNVTIPPSSSSIPTCNDNFAMVEFGNVFRVYYVFRPHIFAPDALQYALEKIGYIIPSHNNITTSDASANNDNDNDNDSQQQQQTKNKQTTKMRIQPLDLFVSNVPDIDQSIFPIHHQEHNNNNNNNDNDKPTTNATTTTRILEYCFLNVLDVLKKIQKETIGKYYYGADNPFIHRPPDIHPCMPGIPDDEVNFLLWKILDDFL